jgi:hypothetical protein
MSLIEELKAAHRASAIAAPAREGIPAPAAPGPLRQALERAPTEEELKAMASRREDPRRVCKVVGEPVQDASLKSEERKVKSEMEPPENGKPKKRHVIVYLVKCKHDYELEYREESKGVWKLIDCPEQLSGLRLEPDILKHQDIYRQQCYQKYKTETLWK